MFETKLGVKIILDDDISSALLIYKIRDVKDKHLLMKPILDSSYFDKLNLVSSRIDLKRDEHYLLTTLIRLFRDDYQRIGLILYKLDLVNNMKFYQMFPKDSALIPIALSRCFYAIENKEVMLWLIKHQYVRSIYEIPQHFRNVKEIVLEIIGSEPLQFHQVGKELRNDREVVMKAVKADVNALQYASRELRHDREFVLEIVEIGIPTFPLSYFSKELRNDFDFVMKLVKVNGLNLRFASNTLRAHSEIVLEAISQNGEAIEYVNLPKTERMWLESIRTYPRVIPKLPKSLQYSSSFWKKAAEMNSNVFDYLQQYCKSNNYREVMLIVFTKFGKTLPYIPTTFRNDREIVITAIQESSFLYQYASEELRNDIEIALILVRKRELYVLSRYVGKGLRKNEEFLSELFKIEPYVYYELIKK